MEVRGGVLGGKHCWISQMTKAQDGAQRVFYTLLKNMDFFFFSDTSAKPLKSFKNSSDILLKP